MKNKCVKRVIRWIIGILLIIITMLVVVYFAVINPIIIESTRLNLNQIGKKAINQSFISLNDERVVYNDLIKISYDDNNRISLIQVNSYQANAISHELIHKTEAIITEMGRVGFYVNAGIFSLLPIFSGSGHNINLRFNQIGAVSCDFSSKFEAAGVNQNIHKLYAMIKVSLGVAFPFHTEVVNIEQNVILCENIIIGDIPNTYLQSTELDSLLNLVPT